jgi:hypothetical protein
MTAGRGLLGKVVSSGRFLSESPWWLLGAGFWELGKRSEERGMKDLAAVKCAGSSLLIANLFGCRVICFWFELAVRYWYIAWKYADSSE